MLAISAGSSIGMCPNCDTVQPTEYNTEDTQGYRKPTTADHRYHLAWERIKRDIYPRAA